MSALLVPIALYDPSVAGVTSVPPWKLDGLKDLSPGGICEMGYGNHNKARQTLQYIANLKHKEKYRTYLGWGVTFIPALLDVLPEILYDENGRTPVRNIPSRTHAVLKKKIGNISAKQLGFLLSIIPLYHTARAIKNSIWMGSGFDPSGHTMFKMTQYGMMLSIATDHGTKSSISKPVIYYIALTTIADSVMLANTFTNCHTLAEVVVGAGLGTAILLAAHLISKHTPLGRWVQGIANVTSEIASRVIGSIRNGRTLFPNQMMA